MLVKDKYDTSSDDDMDSIMESILAGNATAEPRLSKNVYQSKPPVHTKVRRENPISNRPNLISENRIRNKRAPSEINDFSSIRRVTPANTNRGNIDMNNARTVQNISNPNSPPKVTARKMTTRSRMSDQGYSADISSEVYADQSSEYVNNNNKKSKRKVLSLVAILISLILIPVISFTILKEPIMALLKPKSPFSTELASQMKIPLYYPTKLPGNYKMEVNSITQPESSVVLYAITDESNNKINISVQRQVENTDTESIYVDSSNTKTIDTKFGEVKFGKTEADLDIANVMTGQSWIIITAPTGTMNEKDLQLIINSMEF